MIELLKGRFKKNFGVDPEAVATAPGRVEVIGNHTDYNQGPVIGAAIDRGVAIAMRRTEEAIFRFSSGGGRVVTVEDPSKPQSGPASWTNYFL